MKRCAVLLVEASKLTDDKNLANCFEAEKKVQFLFRSYSTQCIDSQSTRWSNSEKKSDLFFRVKKIKKCSKHGNIRGLLGDS